jgi:hypothetical protein
MTATNISSINRLKGYLNQEAPSKPMLWGCVAVALLAIAATIIGLQAWGWSQLNSLSGGAQLAMYFTGPLLGPAVSLAAIIGAGVILHPLIRYKEPNQPKSDSREDSL